MCVNAEGIMRIICSKPYKITFEILSHLPAFSAALTFVDLLSVGREKAKL